jgi:hypothetical protein
LPHTVVAVVDWLLRFLPASDDDDRVLVGENIGDELDGIKFARKLRLVRSVGAACAPGCKCCSVLLKRWLAFLFGAAFSEKTMASSGADPDASCITARRRATLHPAGGVDNLFAEPVFSRGLVGGLATFSSPSV